jgi:hypothetical protein
MAKTPKTPRPQKSPVKAKAALNKMKGAATTVLHSPGDSDEPDVPDEAEVKVGIESVVWDHPEAEQKIKADEISVDDGATGIQSVMGAAAAVVSLSGLTTTKTALAVGPKNPKAKKPSPSKRKTPASKVKKPGPPSDDQVFWLRFSELYRYKADHGTMSVPRSKHGTNNVLANWIHYIRKRYARNLLADKYKSSLNGINFQWTACQITKKGFEGWFAGLVEYHKQNDTVEVLGENKKEPAACQVGKLCKENSHRSADEQEKNAEFTLQRCKMLVDIGLVPLQFYLYQSEDSDGVGEHQDSTVTQSDTGTRLNATQTLTETTSTTTQSFAVITINVTQSVASTSRKMAKDNNQKIEEDEDILEGYDRKLAAIVFATAGNVTQPLVTTTGNETQSLAATVSNVTQSLAVMASNVAADNDDRKPTAIVFATAGNVTQPLEATAGNKTQSLAATVGNVSQSLAATASDVAHSTVAATDSGVAQSLAAMASNVAHSTVAATGSAAHSTSFTEANTEAGLASFSPEMIVEDAAAREMLLEKPPLMPQVIETLLAIFHPIICLQLLTILPFIHRWLQMMLSLEKK